MVLAQRIARHGFERFFCAENGLFKHATLEKVAHKTFYAHVIGRVFALVDLFDDHPALLVEFDRIERRIEIHIGKHIRAFFHVRIERNGVETGATFGRVRIDLRADRVYLVDDIEAGASFRAFEQHVLDKMGYAVDIGSFSDDARTDKYAERNRSHGCVLNKYKF